MLARAPGVLARRSGLACQHVLLPPVQLRQMPVVTGHFWGRWGRFLLRSKRVCRLSRLVRDSLAGLDIEVGPTTLVVSQRARTQRPGSILGRVKRPVLLTPRDFLG